MLALSVCALAWRDMKRHLGSWSGAENFLFGKSWEFFGNCHETIWSAIFNWHRGQTLFFGNKSKTERKAGKFVVPPLSGSCGSNGQRHRTFSFSTFWILSLLSVPSLDFRGFSYGSDLLFQRTKWRPYPTTGVLDAVGRNRWLKFNAIQTNSPPPYYAVPPRNHSIKQLCCLL